MRTQHQVMLAALCAMTFALSGTSIGLAGPNAHADSHATSNNGNSEATGNGGASQSTVRQYALANGLNQGQVASSLKSWNSLNANPKALIKNLNDPNSLLGKEARYVCANAISRADLTTFTSLGGNPANPPTSQQFAEAQAYLAAVALLNGADPNTVLADPTSSQQQIAAAKLVISSSLTTASAQSLINQYNAWTPYQTAEATAESSFLAASVSYKGSTYTNAMGQLRAQVDAVVAQKGLDTSTMCGTTVAAK